MAFWTVLGSGIEGDVQGRKFGISLDTSNGKWTASGPSVSMFFHTLSGKFALSGIPELGTQLIDSSSKEVAFLRGLLNSSVVGSSGNGRASETGVNFDWVLDSK